MSNATITITLMPWLAPMQVAIKLELQLYLQLVQPDMAQPWLLSTRGTIKLIVFYVRRKKTFVFVIFSALFRLALLVVWVGLVEPGWHLSLNVLNPLLMMRSKTSEQNGIRPASGQQLDSVRLVFSKSSAPRL